ncbi:hypothetical protein Ciccas_001951 [Cichlidogyrus casuarinus]|uniref:RRM domain-containing protein n=1 Tax=Cichlidogyrus casuarinus TaxID=1844966 RepID=A0ABD2QKV9_9PLAT
MKQKNAKHPKSSLKHVSGNGKKETLVNTKCQKTVKFVNKICKKSKLEDKVNIPVVKKSLEKSDSDTVDSALSDDEMYRYNSTDMEDSVTDESEILSASELEQLLDDKVPNDFDYSDSEESSDYQTKSSDDSDSDESSNNEEKYSIAEEKNDKEDQKSRNQTTQIISKPESYNKEAISRGIELASRSLHFTTIPAHGCTLENLKQLSPSLQSARFSQSQKNKSFKSFAFLIYPDSEAALKARKVLLGRQFGGKSVVTKPMQIPNYLRDNALNITQLTVCCMHPSVKVTDLKQIFPSADSIVLPKCPSSPVNNHNLGYAFINFVDPKLALEAFLTAHNRLLQGLPLHINFSAKEISDRKMEHVKARNIQKKPPLLLKKESEDEKSDEPESCKEVMTKNSRRVLIKKYSDSKDDVVRKCDKTRQESSSSDDEEIFLTPKGNISKSDFSSLISAAKKKTALDQASGSEDDQGESGSENDQGESDKDSETSDEDSEESDLEVEEEESSEEEVKSLEEEERAEEEVKGSGDQDSCDDASSTKSLEEYTKANEEEEEAQLSAVLNSMKQNKRALKRGGTKRPRRPTNSRVKQTVLKRKKL